MQNLPMIKEGALFIADAHFHDNDARFFELIERLNLNPPSQVFFMGDIFHLLIGHIPSSLNKHLPLLKKINDLSLKSEVFYFEGNHDFALPQSLLPKVKIYPRKLQPALFSFENKKILLAHGDIFISAWYSFYINTLNNPIILSLLKIIDSLSFGKIYQKIHAKIMLKKIIPLHNNANFSKKRIYHYNNFSKKNHISFDYILEGHFHTILHQENYLAIPSFYCHKKILQMSKKHFYNLI